MSPRRHASGRGASDRDVGAVVDHQPQPGQLCRQSGGIRETVRGDEDIHREIRIRQTVQILQGHPRAECGGEDLSADADTLEGSTSSQPTQVSCELRGPDRQVPNHAKDAGVLRGEIQQPVVVLDPRAGLHDDGADHPHGPRQAFEFKRQIGTVEDRIVW